MTFRFVILTAVSDPKQAEREKDSLDDQFRKGLLFGEREGGTFVREYRADGYSRSGYWDLSQAFSEIPAFGDIQRDTYKNVFDVVIVDSYDRFGSTVFAFWEFLKPHKKQFRSAQQALPIEPPATYNPSRDDSTTNMIVSAMMIQGYRINKIVRAFEIGNKRRVKDGLYGNRIPLGYTKIDKSTVVPDGHYSGLIAKLPEWYLSGKTTGEVVNLANASGVLPRGAPRWTNRVITYLLQNQFYAGRVFYQGETNAGKHEALWTWDTYLAVQAELERRKTTRHVKRDYNLTGLLHCSTCGIPLRISYSTQRSYKNWACDQRHVRIRTEKAEEQVTAEIIRLLADRDFDIDTRKVMRHRAQNDLVALGRQFTKLEQAYFAGAFDALEFADRKKELEARRSELQNEEYQQEEARRQAEENKNILATMRDILPFVGNWLVNSDPRQVKYHLSRLFRFTIDPNRTIKAELIV
jgi:hypothetical protein